MHRGYRSPNLVVSPEVVEPFVAWRATNGSANSVRFDDFGVDLHEMHC
jgi:hypothetical protein